MTFLSKISNYLQSRPSLTGKKPIVAEAGPLVSSPSVLSKMDTMIGISNLPNQMHRICSKKGLQYNILLVGEAGIGKSSLIHTLLGAKSETIQESRDQQRYDSTSIQVHQLEFHEKSFPVRLSVIKTPGFGNTVQSDQSWTPIIDYIDEQYAKYLDQENSIDIRSNRVYEDSRVHVCLYFIPATTRTKLKAIDILTMKKLGEKVNLIPIISQSEILSEMELDVLKLRLLDDMERYKIRTYQLPEDNEFSLDLSNQNRDTEQEETDAKLAAALNLLVLKNAENQVKDSSSIFERIKKKKKAAALARKSLLLSSHSSAMDSKKEPETLLPFHIKEAMPFAVFSSTHELETGKGGKKAKGRSYPWGQVDIEDSKSSDMTKLRCCLIRTHLYDLLNKTSDLYYEQFRVETLEKKTVKPGDRLSMIIHNQTPEQIEAKYRQDLLKMKCTFEKEWAKEDEKLKLKESQYIQIAAAHDHELEELRQYAANLQKEILMFQKSPSASSVVAQ